ncbi:MAG: tetratricopeptide repeat protein, partial [Planctomycetota bacterium]
RFDFERALGQYQALLERFPARAEVLAGLARLEARFRLFDEAEERLREAIERDRGNYLGHYELGRLMLELDRPAEAVEALSRAFTRLPSGTGAAGPRHAVRLALGRAHLTLGQVPEATEVYRDAVNARDDSQEALAGLAACALLGDAQAEAQLPGWLLSGGTPPSESFEAVGFDLLLVGGLLAIRDGRLSDAVNGLREALVADPLRAAAAHRALAWAAEIAGEDDAAIEAIEVALVSDPTDVWSHYTRGRLLLDRDDTLEAAASFRRALELESDFEDALAGLGEIAWRDGESEAAELFFERVERLVAERARAVEAGAPVAGLGGERRADIQALRGMNLLNLGEFLAARDIFEGVLIDRTGYGPALAGAAWATYRLDDVEEALIQFRGLDDSLRSRPEDDPLRVWSRQQLERVSEHVAKDLWSDRFEYSTLGNGWERVEAAGPQASLQDGELVLSGNFRKVGEARYQRLYEAAQFISIQARIKVSGDSNARTGLFVSREMGRGQGTRIQAYAAVARSRDGTAQVRTVVPGREESDWADLPRTAFPFPADEWMTLAIERRGEGASTTVTLFMDGIPVLEEVPMTNLARGNNALQVGVFAEGDTGRRVEVRMDDVEVVRTQGGR